MGGSFLPDPGFWSQTTFPTSSSSVPLSGSWLSHTFLFTLVCRKHLTLLLFGLYLCHCTLFPNALPSPPLFLPNLSVLWEVFPDMNTSHEFPLIADQALCTSHPAHAS